MRNHFHLVVETPRPNLCAVGCSGFWGLTPRASIGGTDHGRDAAGGRMDGKGLGRAPERRQEESANGGIVTRADHHGLEVDRRQTSDGPLAERGPRRPPPAVIRIQICTYSSLTPFLTPRLGWSSLLCSDEAGPATVATAQRWSCSAPARDPDLDDER